MLIRAVSYKTVYAGVEQLFSVLFFQKCSSNWFSGHEHSHLINVSPFNIYLTAEEYAHNYYLVRIDLIKNAEQNQIFLVQQLKLVVNSEASYNVLWGCN